MEIKFSSHSELYDLLVAKDNKLRQAREAIDFSLVYDGLKDKHCMDNGREAVNPITMFKYLFLKAHSGLSDIDLVERVRTDLSYKYFLDMSPEELPIDSSLLSFFRRKRLKDARLLDALIRETVSVALERGLVNRRSDIIVDATHTVSKYTPYNPKDLLKRRSKAFRKALYRYDGSLAGKVEKDHDVKEVADEIAYCKALVLEYGRMMEGGCVNKDLSEAFNSLKESIEDIEERYTTSPSDRDAKAGSKGRGNDFFGYKTHLAETPEGIVTAAVVTSGEQGDGPHAAEPVDKTVGNGLEVDALIGDAAYSGKAILEKGAREGFKVVAKLHPAILSGYRKAEPGMEFGFNKDADMSGRTHGREEEGDTLCEGEGEGQLVHAVRLRRRQVRAVPAEGEVPERRREGQDRQHPHPHGRAGGAEGVPADRGVQGEVSGAVQGGAEERAPEAARDGQDGVFRDGGHDHTGRHGHILPKRQDDCADSG